MSEVNNVEDIISSENIGFSNILRNAREQKGLSLADVGAQLRLDENIIYAIESNNLEQLPEPAYVCGYIRNYARLMALDPTPLVDNFKEKTSLKTTLSSVAIVSQKLEKKAETRSIFFIIFLIILLFLGVFFAWQLWEDNALEFFSNTQQKNNNSSTLLLDNTELLETAVVKKETKNIDTNINPIKPDKENEETLDPISEIDPISEVENRAPVEGEMSQDDSNTSLPENVENNDIENQPANTELVNKNLNAKKQLKFKFTKNSWISVKDGNTNSLIYDLVHKGEEIILYGKSPVDIFLGDGTGVELSVDGQMYNFASSINKKNIAKFIVE